MLDEMRIENVALIRQASFCPGEGLTVITGETGSGKTALMNSLALLAGERANTSAIREGSDELGVEGRFFCEPDDTEGIIVSRRLSKQGRSRITIDGSLGSVSELASRIGSDIDLCGQHEHQHLLSSRYQRELFDRWGGEEIASKHSIYEDLLKQSADALANLQELESLSKRDAAELDHARFVIDQIETVNPEEGEYNALIEEVTRGENSEMLIRETNAIYEALTGEAGIRDQLESVMGSFQRIHDVDPSLSAQQQLIEEAYYSLEGVGSQLLSYQSGVDFSLEELEIKQNRIAALQGLMRSYGPTMKEVFATLERNRDLINCYDSRDELIEQARKNYRKTEDLLIKAAKSLSEERKKRAPQFERDVAQQLSKLDMGSACVDVKFEELERSRWNQWGPHTLEFYFRPARNSQSQKLSAIASGGEISRVMLALKIVLGACDTVHTLVFDEIDAGIGGHAALALGEVLVQLAQTHQVIVITHLAQIAALGQVHYKVEKIESDRLETTIVELGSEERVDEIARMLSGEVSGVARAHAQELLSGRLSN